MGCCDETQIKRIPDMDGLPDSTYYCMARLAYALTCVAEYHYTGRALMGWDGLADNERESYVDLARQAPKGDAAPTDRLFYNFVRMLMSAV